MTVENKWRPVALVASREIKEKLADRKFLTATLALTLLVIGLVVAPALMQRGASYTVGAAPSIHQQANKELLALEKSLGVSLSVRQTSEADARQQLLEGTIDAYVASPTRVLVLADPPATLANALQQGIGDLAVRETIAARNLDPATAHELLSAASLHLETVDDPGHDAAAREVAARVAVFVLFGQIATYAFWVASGVVEEKSNRVVELVVSAIRPWQLLIGKIAGIGLLGLGQLLITGAAGLGAAVAVGSITWDHNLVAALAVSLAAYALGFVFYASLYAAAASTVSRQEELGSATGVVQGVLMGSLVVSFMALDPGSAMTRVASWLPMTSPLLAPPQLLAGRADLGSVVGAAVLLVACVAVVIAVAARLYARAVLHTRGRLSLRSAWRNGAHSSHSRRSNHDFG